MGPFKIVGRLKAQTVPVQKKIQPAVSNNCRHVALKITAVALKSLERFMLHKILLRIDRRVISCNYKSGS